MRISELRRPIFQAPTGSIAGPDLAVAVTEAGGVGALGLTWTPVNRAVESVRLVKSRTPGPFQVNFALAFPPEALDPVLDEGVPIVTFSWGMPAIYAERVRRAGVTLGVQVATVEAAKQAVDLGAHFLIVQGVEAGGHVQSSQPLVRLLEAVVDLNLPIPIVAAGGIVNHEDIQRALGMGASAAMLGTRFVATKESLAHSRYKEALAHEHETALTICFDGGWPNAPHRVLRNKTLVDWESMGCPRPGNRPGENDVLARSASGEPIYRYEDTAPREGMSGQIEEMCLYAGTGVDRIADIPSVSQLMQSLWPLS